MHVVEHEQHGRRLARGLQQRRRGFQRTKPLALGLGQCRQGHAGQPRVERRQQPHEVARARAELDAQLVDRAGGDVRAQRLRERLRGSGETLVAAPVQHNPALLASVRSDLGRQARLADAGLAADQDALAPPRDGVGPRRLQPRDLRLAPGEGGAVVDDEGRGERDGDRALGRPADGRGAHRLHQTPQRQLARVLEPRVGSRPGEQAHGIGDQDGPRRRGGAQPLRLDHRRTEGVAALPRDVAGGDADAQLERDRAATRLAVDRPLHLHGAGDGGAGSVEGSQQAVAERFDPHAAMRREHVAQPAIVLTVQRIGVLVAQPRAYSRRAREICDEDRRRRAAALHLGGRLLRRRRASQQSWILGEDRVLQAVEFGSGTQAELRVKRPHRSAVGVQRLPLTPGAI